MRSRTRTRERSRRRDEPEQSIFQRPEPGARRAAYSRDQIAAVAIEIADAEGFPAVSMRRVARELGAGTMTLYHYVRNKDELIALVDDAIMGELLIPEGELPDDWREALAAIARRTRDAFMRHPWVFEIPPLTEGGPNGTRHFEQTLAAAAGTGLELVDRIEVAALVDDYVFGFAVRRNQFLATSANMDPKEMAAEFSEHARSELASLDPEGYPNVAAMFADRDPEEVLTELLERALGPERFEHGLELLLDGIERRIERPRA
jgi:AcrR family transcriptional regulator